jgi:hypothetical protein
VPETQSDVVLLRAELARASRRGHDPAEAVEIRRRYAEAKLADLISETIASAPPLTPEQAARLSALLRSGSVTP